jgi:hypothetical protein
MILYTKTFPLGKGISFARYINILDENSFPPFTLLIKKTPGTKKALIEVVLTAPPFIWSSSGFIVRGVLFNEITIEYLERRSFILKASVGVGNLIMSFFYIVFSGFLLSFMLFEAVINKSVENFLFMLVAFSVTLYPWISTYLREIKFLDRIGSLGSEMDEK